MEIREVENFKREENVEFSKLEPNNKDFQVSTGSATRRSPAILVIGGPNYSSTVIMRDEKVHKINAESS